MGLNNILQGDALKISLLFFLVSSFFMVIVKDVRKLFSKNKKKAMLYALVVLLVFALVGLLSSSKVLNNTALNSFIGFQVLFLVLGGIHVWVLRTFFKELSENKSKFFNEFFFTLAFVFIGLIAFFKVTETFKAPFKFLFLTSAVTFIIPLMFYKLYEFALLIPVKIYKQWLYPLGKNIKDPTQEELKNPLVISFEFKKKNKDRKITNFRVKAPENLEFGKLFYFFLNDYNERHPEGKIDYLNKDEKTPQSWIFYKKPSFLSSLKYVDFSKSIRSNNLRENDVIICQRT